MHVVYSKNRDEPANSSFNSVYEQYVNEAAFLWILRSIAINEPHNDKNNILLLEQRIDNQLDGLLTSMDTSWQACEDALDLIEPGEVFAAMNFAMRTHDSIKIKKVVYVGLSSDAAKKGLVSAMGWLPNDIANNWIERFLNGKDMQHKYLGIASCSVRRTDPGEALVRILKREDCIQDVNLFSRALRLVGELRRQDCMPFLINAINNENETIQFWANWSAILLGHHASIENLKPFIFKPNALQDKAIQLAFRVLDVERAREWISELSKDDKQVRVVIKSIGVLGDPHAINWLINKMSHPLYAKLAAESFTYITGVDFKKSNLTMTPPDNYPTIPDNNIDDEFVALDEDENLPYPDVQKITSIWQKFGQKFIVGKRYFMGQLITAESLKQWLQNGSQRQRQAAALELALCENGFPLVNTKAKMVSA